jgi:hypothetical protein
LQALHYLTLSIIIPPLLVCLSLPFYPLHVLSSVAR